MPVSDQDAVRYASESGFPLQIAVQHAVDESVSTTGWSVRYVEHGWVHPQEQQKGFIDLVLHRDRGRHLLVVECKRQRDAAWVFMHYSGTAASRRHFRPWITHAGADRIVRHAWTDKPLDPACPEATFCAVRGQNSNERNTLLERTGSELVLATEALAHSERDLRVHGRSSVRYYYPLIVTTADLRVADFDPATVSLEDGEISAANVRNVPFLRFRKQLATRFVVLGPSDLTDRGDPSYTMESSIFVVHASRLVQFLAEFDPPDDDASPL